jgi:hypothetical protein
LEVLADLVILTEYTGKVATGEKNSAGAFGAGNGWLFTEMEACMAYLDRCRDSAKTELAG